MDLAEFELIVHGFGMLSKRQTMLFV